MKRRRCATKQHIIEESCVVMILSFCYVKFWLFPFRLDKERERDENKASTSLISRQPFTPSGSMTPSPSQSSTPTPAPLIPSQTLSWQETKGSIKERTSCLVNSEKLSDITFLVGPNETPIHGHKTILSAGSPYFEKLFFGPMASNEAVHKICDIEPEVLVVFLKVRKTV